MPACHSFNASACKDNNIFSNPSNMNKIISFLKESNRYKHLIGGLLVGLFAMSSWTAIYSAVVVASCLELMDKLKDYYWDWPDWLLMVGGGGIAAIFWVLM